MRVVADTNTVVSGLVWQGSPRLVLNVARQGKIALFTSAALLAELEDVLSRKKLAAQIAKFGSSPQELILDYLGFVRLVQSASINSVVIADSDDDEVVATAVAAQAQAIVSGDSDLLDLIEY